jgi:hypothetical protein
VVAVLGPEPARLRGEPDVRLPSPRMTPRPGFRAFGHGLDTSNLILDARDPPSSESSRRHVEAYPLGEQEGRRSNHVPVRCGRAGLIVYGEDGYMSVALMRRRRKAFDAGDLLRGTPEEKAKAAEEYVSYCGRYDFEGETVIHHVELSLFPNWVGVDQERLVEIDGGRLTLSTRPLLLDGIEQTAHLVWERA